MNDETVFMVQLSDEEVRTLYYAVTTALEFWPGSPARPADEQEKLWAMRDSLFRMKLEMSFDTEA